MKKFCLTLLALMSFSAFGKIIHKEDMFFIETNGDLVPIVMVNELIQNKKVSAVKLYDSGNVNMITFAKHGGRVKNYSVDHKGFAYAIEPFTSHRVEMIDKRGLIRFAEYPGRKYYITKDGFFIIHR